VAGTSGIGTPGCRVRVGAIFRSHVGLPLPGSISWPLAAQRDGLASPILVRRESFSGSRFTGYQAPVVEPGGRSPLSNATTSACRL
jgi:hypothetical protein